MNSISEARKGLIQVDFTPLSWGGLFHYESVDGKADGNADAKTCLQWLQSRTDEEAWHIFDQMLSLRVPFQAFVTHTCS